MADADDSDGDYNDSSMDEKPKIIENLPKAYADRDVRRKRIREMLKIIDIDSDLRRKRSREFDEDMMLMMSLWSDSDNEVVSKHPLPDSDNDKKR